ncbi:MAG: hypothetical protein ACQET1_10765 [Gemmatimonadota bacterium]
MTERPSTREARTPVHLWVVGVLALLWNAMGAFDYLMTQTENEGYMSRFTPEQLEFFYGFPTWVVASWALAVWGSVLGSILLLMRNRWAVPVFLVSFLSMCVTTFRNYVLADGMEVAGDPFTLLFSALIFLVALGLLLYARAMKRRGVLE